MNIAIISFVIALGFVTSAVLYNGQLAIRGANSGFRVPFHNVGYFLLGFAFFMFVGPYLVMERSVTFWRLGAISIGLMSFCSVIALLWSFCSGVFVAQLLLATGIVTI